MLRKRLTGNYARLHRPSPLKVLGLIPGPGTLQLHETVRSIVGALYLVSMLGRVKVFQYKTLPMGLMCNMGWTQRLINTSASGHISLCLQNKNWQMYTYGHFNLNEI